MISMLARLLCTGSQVLSRWMGGRLLSSGGDWSMTRCTCACAKFGIRLDLHRQAGA